MKIILLIFGILFLMMAMSSFIVAAILACAPLVAFVLFCILGVILVTIALDMDGTKALGPHGSEDVIASPESKN